MLGLEYIAAGYLTLADVKVKCESAAVPEITVRAVGIETVLDETKSIKELNAFKPVLGESPYGKGVDTHVEGLMHGKIGLDGRYQFSTRTYPSLKKVCMQVSQVEVVFTLDPKVYIAKEYPRGSCHYNAVLEHEKKHLRVDRDLVNKYSFITVKAINNTLKQVGYMHGPYDEAQLPALQKQIGGIIESVIGQFSENMNRERKVLQKQIDSLAEYERVDKVCPDKLRPDLR